MHRHFVVALAAGLVHCSAPPASTPADVAGPDAAAPTVEVAGLDAHDAVAAELTPADAAGAEAAPDSAPEASADAVADLETATEADAAPACLPGPATCASAHSVLVCGADGVAQTLLCGPAQLCVAGKCKMQLCKPGATACDGAKVAACDATGTAVQWVKDCAAQGLLCENAVCAPKVCDAGTKHCAGDVAEVCSPVGTAWLTVADCAVAGAVCKLGACAPIPCADGGLGCEGNAVVQCSGKNWQPVQDCGAKAEVCAAGKCQKTLCNVGDFDCVGGLYTTCEPPGLVWSLPLACPLNTACAPGIGCLPAPGLCQPDDTGCKGTQPMVCDASGAATATGEDCANSGQVCSGGACKPKICKPGALGCQDNHAVACNDAGTQWLLGQDCGAQTCVAGTCKTKVCGQGQTTCAGAGLALCGGAWQIAACPKVGEVCLAGACVAPTCKPNPPTGPVVALAALAYAPVTAACDLNGDNKPDSALGALAQFNQAGASAQAALGKLRVLLWSGTPQAPEVAILPAIATPTASWSTCPGPNCALSVEPDGYELLSDAAMCPAKAVLAGGLVDLATGQAAVGGGGSVVVVPLQAGILALEVPLFGAQLVGKLSGDLAAPKAFAGVLCGAVPHQALAAAFDQVPDAAFAGGAAAKLQFAKLVVNLVQPDLDLDGDGTKESVSAAFAVSAGPAQSVGLAK
ncbi:MAG: hypothetical protein FJ100_09790 [Deltaproteobacteria bacterium]|nr:hypothetical protein [Deltaproteobacteria bacterium]